LLNIKVIEHVLLAKISKDQDLSHTSL